MNARVPTTVLLTLAALTATSIAAAQTTPAPAASSAQPSRKTIHAQNRQLERAVRRALDKTPDLTASDIRVLASGHVITLEGTVPSEPEVQLASNAAHGVHGVSTVKNNLLLREPGH
jgi:hyperosmotically inducible periplasmic protein